VEAIIPTLGLGTFCSIQVTTLFPYRPTMEQHLSFEKGETINVSEQQVIIMLIIKKRYTFYKAFVLFRTTGGTVQPTLEIMVGSLSRM